jgi:MFS family permease
MLQKIARRVVRNHHPWRKMKFDELAELYTSMSLRSLGFSLIGIFVPVYLYQAGITLSSIFLFYGFFFLLRIPVAYVAGYIIARIGPKHTIAISTIIFIVFLGLLLSYTSLNWPLYMLAVYFTLANGLFFVAYNTDFSKVKHNEHGGKELGWLYIFERGGGALGPVVGGIIAAVFAPEATIIFAITVFIVSLVPLFLTNEPVKLHQHIHYSGFPHRKHASDFWSLSAFNIVNVANGVFWPLLMAVFIFTEDTYAKLGAVVGLSLAISVFSARMFGKFIDSKKGRGLMQYGVGMSAVLNIVRAFITNGSGAVAVSVLGEPIGLSYRMPLIKGFYDAADSEEGYRIVYLVWAEIWTGLAKGAYCISLYFASLAYDPITVLRYNFIGIALIGIVMLTQRFPILKKV